MINLRGLTETVTLHMPGTQTGTSDYGDPIYGDTTKDVKAQVIPLDSTEDEILRDTRIQRFNVYLSPDVSVSGLGWLAWRSKHLEIITEPLTYYVRGVAHHIEIQCREALG